MGAHLLKPLICTDNRVAMACRVLIVEDQADLREMMDQMLTLEGFDTDTAPFKKVRSPHGSGFRAK